MVVGNPTSIRQNVQVHPAPLLAASPSKSEASPPSISWNQRISGREKRASEVARSDLPLRVQIAHKRRVPILLDSGNPFIYGKHVAMKERRSTTCPPAFVSCPDPFSWALRLWYGCLKPPSGCGKLSSTFVVDVEWATSSYSMTLSYPQNPNTQT